MRVGTVVTGLTFAAHPIHTEAVSGIVGRADLAACNLFLLSFLLYSEHIRLREEQQRRQCRHVTKSIMLHRKIAPSDQPFRLSCHGLVQHIMMNFRRLLKASRAGPMKIFEACEVKTGTVKLKCQSDSVSEETGELIKWLTLSGTLLFAAAGTLCKEPAVMVLPLCIFYDFIKGTRQDEPYSKVRKSFLPYTYLLSRKGPVFLL